MSLARVQGLLKNHDLDAALGALLESWREVRDPRLANLIDRVSASVASRAPFEGKTISEREAAWHTVAAQRAPRDLPRLIAAWPKKWNDGVDRLRALKHWDDDPRLDAALVELTVHPPYTSRPASFFFSELHELLRRIHDPRSMPALRALAAKGKDKRVHDTLALLEARYRRVPALDDPALAGIEGYFASAVATESTDASRGDALLRAILDAPGDDRARSVYADWLIERDDPRGNFIALQLARGERPPDKTERTLLAKHATRWAGKIGELFTDWVFDRGFFAGGRVRIDQRERLRGEPAVRLVTHARIDHHLPIIEEVLAQLPSLTSLDVSNGGITLASGPKRPLVRFGINIAELSPKARKPLERCAAFPALRELRIETLGDPTAWLVEAPVLARLARLVVRRRAHAAAEVAALLARVPELVIETLYVRIVIVRAAREARVEAVDGVSTSLDLPALMADALKALPDDLARLSFELGGRKLTAEGRSTLKAATARFTSAKVVL